MTNEARIKIAYALGAKDAKKGSGYGCWPLSYTEEMIEAYDRGYYDTIKDR